jgi:hypothetical protein
MSALAQLKALFRRTDTAPPRMAISFSPSGLDEPDEADLSLLGKSDSPDLKERRTNFLSTSTDIQRIDDDVWGLTFAIEYRDGKGTMSRRRITLRHLYAHDNGTIYVQAHCHERDAPRSFRFDRITAVIDMDGVIHLPSVFFAEELRVALPSGIGIPLPRLTATPTGSRAAPDRSGYEQRRIARDGLRVLVALARSDGMMAPEEVDVILDYIAEKADRAGITMSEVDRGALKGYLQRQRPSPDVLEACLDGLEKEPVVEQHLFLRSAIALMDADGIHDGAEFDMLLSIQERLNAIS